MSKRLCYHSALELARETAWQGIPIPNTAWQEFTALAGRLYLDVEEIIGFKSK